MNFIQKSILRTRQALFDMQRKAAVERKHKQRSEEKANAQMELLLDSVCAETGLELNEQNLPIIALHVQGILLQARRAREEQEPEDDYDGLKDFAF